MVKIVYNQPSVCASNNGYWSQFFTPTRATGQGCCLSPAIFNLVVKLLGLGIRQNPRIMGIELNGDHIKAGQFADDLWATLIATDANINELLNEITFFGKFSGLRLNTDKCQVLRIGTYQDSDAKCYTLRCLYWSPHPIKILGIYIHPNWEKMHNKNYDKLLEKVKDILLSWSYRSLSPLDRVVAVNNLVNSLFTHKFLAIPSPNKQFFQTYKNLITEFIWGKKTSTIAYDKLIQNYTKMGLKLIDLEVKDIAVKAMWPVRWKERDHVQMKWLYHHLPLKDNRIWYCNLDPKDISQLEGYSHKLPSYNIIKAWAQYSYVGVVENQEEILFSNICGNSLIRWQNKPIFRKALFGSKMEKILDIYHTQERRFYTCQEIENQLGKGIDNMLYLGILAAIPRMWKQILKNTHDEEYDYEYKIDLLNRSKKLSQTIYWSLLETKFPVNLTLKTLWCTELGSKITEEEWWNLFSEFLTHIKPNKYRYFQFRILHKRLTTNIRHHYWNKEISDRCSFCKVSPETIVHLLYYCPKVQPLWLAVQKICNYYWNVELRLCPELVIFNNYAGQHKSMMYLIIIIMKQYIYAEKCLGNMPTFPNYLIKLSTEYAIEKCYAKRTNNLANCIKKWSSLF